MPNNELPALLRASEPKRYDQEKQLNYQKLRKWLLDVWRWLGEAKPVLMGILMFLAAFLLGFVTWRTEQSIRIAGYGLQLTGMILAIRGLLRIREHFERSPLRQPVIKWLKRFPRWKMNVTAKGSGSLAAVESMAGRMEGWTPDDPEKFIEQRIEGIIKNQNIIQNRLRENSLSLHELKYSHGKDMKQVADEQINIKKQFQSDLKSLHINDLIISLIGLIWLTVGISLSTLAPELLKWLD